MKSRKKTTKVRKAQKKARPAEAPSDRFIKDLEARGEAAELTREGKLPKGATHAIVEKNPDGTLRSVKRGRFYLTGPPPD